MRKLESLFPSDRLKELTERIQKLPAFNPLLKEILQVWFIVDANIIQEQLRWRLGKRRNPNARSGFHEAVDAGLFVPVAPTYLKSEIQEHLGEIAVETGVTLETARAEWDQVQAYLHFYQIQASQESTNILSDPDDAPLQTGK